MLRGERGRRDERDDDVWPILDDFRRQRGQSCEIALCGAPIDDDVLSVDIAEIAHRPKECRFPGIGTRRKKADPVDLRSRLRVGNRPRDNEATRDSAKESPSILDTNDNGRRDAGEPGAANVTVLLDQRFSMRTDSAGRFEFPFVAAGAHTIAVLPDNLPLPWVVEGDRREITVGARESAQLDIPARRLR